MLNFNRYKIYARTQIRRGIPYPFSIACRGGFNVVLHYFPSQHIENLNRQWSRRTQFIGYFNTVIEGIGTGRVELQWHRWINNLIERISIGDPEFTEHHLQDFQPGVARSGIIVDAFDPEGQEEQSPAAIKFSLSHPAVSTVITGIRNTKQAERNAAVSDLMDPPDRLLNKMRKHAWLRAFWYAGK